MYSVLSNKPRTRNGSCCPSHHPESPVLTASHQYQFPAMLLHNIPNCLFLQLNDTHSDISQFFHCSVSHTHQSKILLGTGNRFVDVKRDRIWISKWNVRIWVLYPKQFPLVNWYCISTISQSVSSWWHLLSANHTIFVYCIGNSLMNSCTSVFPHSYNETGKCLDASGKGKYPVWIRPS